MSRPSTLRLPLAGAAIFLALGFAACGGSDEPTTTAAASGPAADATPAAAEATATAPEAVPAAPPADAAPSAAPTTTVAKKAAPPTTAARTTTPTSPPTTAAATPPTTAAPVTPKFAPGQRINPTSAQVQAAITTLSQRIPLFKPTESQLRTFADAACTSFDQGQSKAQVESTVRQAVTYVQGATLSAADAEFAVKTVVSLRCPGYLP